MKSSKNKQQKKRQDETQKDGQWDGFYQRKEKRDFARRWVWEGEHPLTWTQPETGNEYQSEEAKEDAGTKEGHMHDYARAKAGRARAQCRRPPIRIGCSFTRPQYLLLACCEGAVEQSSGEEAGRRGTST